MDVLYAEGAVTARQIMDKMPEPPSYSTVRTLLAVLVRKGLIAHRKSGKALVYRPIQRREKAAESALLRVVSTFFGGSVEQAVSGLLTLKDQELCREELVRLEKMIKEAKRKR